MIHNYEVMLVRSIFLDHLRLYHYHHRSNFFLFSRITLHIRLFRRLGSCLSRVSSLMSSLLPSHSDDLTQSFSQGPCFSMRLNALYRLLRHSAQAQIVVFLQQMTRLVPIIALLA